MLDQNPANITAIVNAIIAVHRQPVQPAVAPLPAGVTVSPVGLMTISYGFNGVQKGSLQITRGQFAVTAVTNAAGAMVVPNYNHAGSANKSQQDFLNALQRGNLSALGNEGCLSAIIYLTSESCRSELVYNVLNVLMHGYRTLTDNESMALQLAVTSYGQTAGFRRYDINAGGSPWTWLGASDYITFFSSPAYNGNRVNNIAMINALSAYVAAGIIDRDL